MADTVDVHGRGPLGTPNNSPLTDRGTNALLQHRPSAPQGAESGTDARERQNSLGVDSLSNEEYQDIERQIRWMASGEGDSALQALQRVRSNYAQRQGENPWEKRFNQAVIDYCDEQIAWIKTPVGRATTDLKNALDDDRKRNKYSREKLKAKINDLFQVAENLPPDSPERAEAWVVISDGMGRVVEHDTDDLNKLADDVKNSSGPANKKIIDDAIKQAAQAGFSDERDREMWGATGDPGPRDPESPTADQKTQNLTKAGLKVVRAVIERDFKAMDELLSQPPGQVKKEDINALWFEIMESAGFESAFSSKEEAEARMDQITKIRNKALLVPVKQLDKAWSEALKKGDKKAINEAREAYTKAVREATDRGVPQSEIPAIDDPNRD